MAVMWDSALTSLQMLGRCRRKKRSIKMVDLTPLDRLIRKRNTQLQKQLDVRLQIMNEEYRMTKKDLEKNTKEISEFLMHLRQTAPGLSSYGQPDTRAMNAKSIMMERRYQSEGDGENVLVPDEILYSSQKTKKGPAGKRDEGGGKDERGGEDHENDRGEEEEGNRLKPSSASSYRNEFFNRKIVLDSKRRSFLQHAMEKVGGKPPVAEKAEDPRRLGGAVSHTGFLSNRDTRGEISRRRPRTSTPRSHRPKTPTLYGRDAYSEQDENIRQYVLNRFDVIFDPRDENPSGKTTPAATPLFVPRNNDEADTSTATQAPSHPGMEAKPPLASSTPVNSSSKYILNRRVAWSAPPKRREDPIAAVANSNSVHPGQRGNRHQNLSVTPRSGTANMVRAQQRPHSIMAIASHDERGIDMRFPNSLAAQQRQNKRPKTAPTNYELKQRSMAAPRQQVAGILAEIQSRRADTRAMLTKSKQLKYMVKKLAPDEPKDDSFSD